MRRIILYPVICAMFFVTIIKGQNIIPVAAGDNAIHTAYSTAVSGDILELTTSGGIYYEDAALGINGKAITIRAASGLTKPPVWKCRSSQANNPLISIEGNLSLTLSGITFDSSSTNSSPRFMNILVSTGGSIKITNCTMQNFTYGFYGSTTGTFDSLLISNCMLSDFSARCLYFPAGTINPGIVKNISIYNTTFKNMKTTEPCIYFYSSASPSYSPSLRLNHVTFYNTQRVRTIAAITDVQIRNTIFATDGTISGGQSFALYGGNVSNTLIFNAPVSGSGAAYSNFQDNVDPQFTNAATGDLTLLATSPAINMGDDGTTLGDSRWWPKNGLRIEAGDNKISEALAIAKDGDVIELITDGGLYKESSSLVINKKITIQSAALLNNKPIWTSDDGDYLIRTEAELNLKGIQLDGQRGALKNVGGIVTNLTGYNIKLTDCDFINFINSDSTNNHAIFSDRYVSQVDSLVISGCTFKNIKDHGIYLGGHLMPAIGSVKYFSLNNSTFSKITNDAIYVRDNDGVDLTPGPVFIVDHCTFYDFAGTYGILSHHIDGSIIKNCIAAAPTSSGKNSFYVYGSNSIVKNSIYYNLTTNLHTAQSQNVVSIEPNFVDAANGNFMVYKNSPAVNAGDDGTTIGDPRWGVSTQISNNLILIKKAYSMSPTENSIRIVWETPESGSKASVVEFGSTKQLGTKITGPDGWLIAGEGYMHEVLITGLTPFTEYYYRISDGTNNDLDTNMFKTAPSAGTNFRLVSLSDIHDNSGSIWGKMSSRIMDFHPDATVFIGDLVNDGTSRSTWDAGYFTPGRPLLSKCTIFNSSGNHETAFGPTTYFDYFSLPTHEANGEDPLRDPTGETYYSMNYGDVKIIAMNANGDDYSPYFNTGSAQLNWLENEISSSTSKWIFIFCHVNVLSTSYHAQWSGDQKMYLMPLYEKYAALGKHIIVYGGDEHNFEHLYKTGVNYVRPGCANTSTRGQYNMADMPYSIFFKQTPGFSTIDLSDNGNIVTLSARDTTGAIFYSASFDARQSTLLPSFYFVSPGQNNDTTSFNYKIQWTDWVDASDSANAYINLYYTADTSQTGTLIASNIKMTDIKNNYVWAVQNVPTGTYSIYAVISNGVITPIKKYASGKVVIIPDIVPPPPATNLTGAVVNGKITLNWINPTQTKHVDVMLGNFEDGINNFIGRTHGTSTGSVLQFDSGYLGKGLQINYNVSVAWDEYAAIKPLAGYPDFSGTHVLDFWYKGDGSNNALRIIAEQDNDRSGTSDDWWYDESLSLSSTAWKHAQLDMTTFQVLSWHPNMKSSFDMANMSSLDFIIPCPTPHSGQVVIDEVKVSGEVAPAPDFQGVVLLRKTGSAPISPSDGEIIYQGNEQTFVDSTADNSTIYYYAVFAFDYANNYSELDTTSVWISSGTTSIQKDKIPIRFELNQNYPNPFNPTTTIKFGIPNAGFVNISVYNIIGQKVYTVVNEYLNEGYYSREFNTSNRLPSGVYIYRIQSGNFTDTKKMLLMK